MNKKVVLSLLAVVALAVGGFFLHRDYEFRSIHGRVTEVSLLTWEQEVVDVKDKEPVLVYFYRENDKTPANERQNAEVDGFAWRTAGRVKVVKVNVAHLENLPLALALGAVRVPAFVILKGDEVISGPSGSNLLIQREDLHRLLRLAETK